MRLVLVENPGHSQTVIHIQIYHYCDILIFYMFCLLLKLFTNSESQTEIEPTTLWTPVRYIWTTWKFKGKLLLKINRKLRKMFLSQSRVYMGETNLPTRAGSPSRITWVNYICFPTKPGIYYLRTSFYFIHKQTELVKWEAIQKNTDQDKLWIHFTYCMFIILLSILRVNWNKIFQWII